MTKCAADPAGCQRPPGPGSPFPGAAQVGGQIAGEPQLDVSGDQQPGPADGLLGVPDPGGGPPELGLRVGDRLRGFDRLPAEAEITNPRHPLAGQRVPVVEAHRCNGAVWLTVTLPDGYPARIPVDDTDLGTARVAGPGTAVLSVAGIRRLRELAAGMAAGGRDQ
jgi:hypothetical protein